MGLDFGYGKVEVFVGYAGIIIQNGLRNLPWGSNEGSETERQI